MHSLIFTKEHLLALQRQSELATNISSEKKQTDPTVWEKLTKTVYHWQCLCKHSSVNSWHTRLNSQKLSAIKHTSTPPYASRGNLTWACAALDWLNLAGLLLFLPQKTVELLLGGSYKSIKSQEMKKIQNKRVLRCWRVMFEQLIDMFSCILILLDHSVLPSCGPGRDSQQPFILQFTHCLNYNRLIVKP